VAYEKEERETHITTDDAMTTWNVFTRQGKIMRRLKKIGVEPCKVVKDEDGRIIEAEYEVDFKQIGFRKLVELTDEQKKERAEIAKRNLHKDSESEE
jgi:hypothetical protein